jgi:hypothetical protein
VGDDDFDTHLFTRDGALCGAASPLAWAWRESLVTCPECRALLERGPRSRRRADPTVGKAQDEDELE